MELATAEAEPDTAIQLNPNYVPAHLWLSHFYSIHGRFPEALQQVRPAFLGFLGYAYGRAGRSADARRLLGELLAAARQGYVSPHALMFVYMGLGDRDKAFEWLERSFSERSNGIAWMAIAPDYDLLRPIPGSAAFLRE